MKKIVFFLALLMAFVTHSADAKRLTQKELSSTFENNAFMAGSMKSCKNFTLAARLKLATLELFSIHGARNLSELDYHFEQGSDSVSAQTDRAFGNFNIPDKCKTDERVAKNMLESTFEDIRNARR